jgi:hypothetical protein
VPGSSIIFLDIRRIRKKPNSYPLKLRLTNDRVSKELQTEYALSVKGYNKLTATNISSNLRKIRDDMRMIESGVTSAMKKISSFDFTRFKIEYIDGKATIRQLL